MKYPPVILDDHQAKAIAIGFGRASAEHGFAIHACAILPEHCHRVIAPNGTLPGQIIGQLKRHAGDALVEARMHALAAFARPGERPPLCRAAGDLLRREQSGQGAAAPAALVMVRASDTSFAVDIRAPRRTRRSTSGG